ncbi:unnamed protein product [Cuscuta epithymum]|uniref:F-box domain-containing protein n=1 Tax=Cuscuta epithymum TaxID=186058 RepID=A0AAV0CDN6_9ASTE|nr:unnamed protein product [Cuscuta epithymum]CAH9145247.1 unnamed protein product [Cuscuta epithymum]
MMISSNRISNKDDEADDEKQREWSDLCEDLLSSILSRLAIGDYLTFKSVCKSWEAVTLPPLSSSMSLLDHCPHDKDSYHDPYLLYFTSKTGFFNFHDPTRNATYSLSIPPLLDDEIGEVELFYASRGWLLLGKGRQSYFFYNPSTKVKIDLPDTLEPLEWACFSGSPTSAWCVYGIYSCHTSITLIATLKLGETRWSMCFPQNVGNNFFGSNCSPVVRNGFIYVLGESGNLGKFCLTSKGLEELCDWKIIGKHNKNQFLKFQDRFLLESDGNLICVATLEGGEVRVLRFDDYNNIWRKIENLNGKSFYVSHRTSISRKTTVSGTGNKIFFPRFYDGKGLFYCLASKKWHNFPKTFSSENYYNTRGIVHCVWTELPHLSRCNA